MRSLIRALKEQSDMIDRLLGIVERNQNEIIEHRKMLDIASKAISQLQKAEINRHKIHLN